MQVFSRCTAILLIALACGTAQASEALEVSVAGRVAATNSCTPTITRSNFSYGTISASQLDRNNPTNLFWGQQTFIVTMDCQAPVNQLFVSFIDHKEDDAVRDTAVLHHHLCSTPDCADAGFGVGRDRQDRKIGALYLWTNGGAIGNERVHWWTYKTAQSSLPNFEKGLFWSRHSNNSTTEYSPSAIDCEASGNAAKNCHAGQRFMIPIHLHLIIDSKDRDITDDVQIDGAFTIELRTI